MSLTAYLKVKIFQLISSLFFHEISFMKLIVLMVIFYFFPFQVFLFGVTSDIQLQDDAFCFFAKY